jgi:small acid-soluble spore protein H (minor)
MQAKRASEIINSPDTIEVLYNNTPVWINSVDESKQVAGIKLLETSSVLQVPVSELRETGKTH